MPIAPVSKMVKQEIVWLGSHRCKCGHTYLEHYACYLKENPLKERIGFFDTENSSLVADFGIMLCYCIKELGTDKIYHRAITPKELRTCMDKEVARQCVKDLSQFSKIYTFYGTRYDFPFVRTRVVANGLPFFNYGELFHQDLWFLIRGKFKLSSNRLENACRILLGETNKTHINPTIWIKALQGDVKSINWIVDHCKRDVTDLEKLWEKVNQFQRETKTSI